MEIPKTNNIGFTCGAFDLLHPGHLYFLSECRKKCDELIVGLHTNPTIDRPDTKNKPVQTMFERWYQLNSLYIATDIIPYDTEADLLNMLSILNINIRFIGWDYKDKKITGEQICKDRDIKIQYIHRSHSWSSSTLRERIGNETKIRQNYNRN